MMMCQQNDVSPSIEMLRAFAIGELHGDEAGELAAHVEQCVDCSRHVNMLKVVGQCDRVIGAEPTFGTAVAEPGIMADWRRIADGLFELPKQLVVSARKLRDLIVTWADHGAVASATPALQLLTVEEKTQVERQIPVAAGAGGLPCSLGISRDKHGDTRIAVGFRERAARECGVLRIRLSREGEFIESRSVDEARSVDDLSWVSFDTVLSAGEYVVEMRGRSGRHRIELKVD